MGANRGNERVALGLGLQVLVGLDCSSSLNRLVEWNGAGAVLQTELDSKETDVMCCCVCGRGRNGGRILMHVGGASDGSRLVVEYQKRYKMHT